MLLDASILNFAHCAWHVVILQLTHLAAKGLVWPDELLQATDTGWTPRLSTKAKGRKKAPDHDENQEKPKPNPFRARLEASWYSFDDIIK